MKALLGERFKCAVSLGIQFHGDIGFTEDDDSPLYSKRAKIWEINLGNTNFHLDKKANTAQIREEQL